MKLPRAKALIYIAAFLVIAGLIEYFIILHVHFKRRVPYMWVHNDLSKIEFENLPSLHKVKRFDSIRDRFYIDQDNFERIQDAIAKRSPQWGDQEADKEFNLAPKLLDANRQVRIPPEKLAVSHDKDSVLHVPLPASSLPVSDLGNKLSNPRESHSNKVGSRSHSDFADHFKEHAQEFNPHIDQQPPDYLAPQQVIARPDHVVSSERKDEFISLRSTPPPAVLLVAKEAQVYHQSPQQTGSVHHQHGEEYVEQEVKGEYERHHQIKEGQIQDLDRQHDIGLATHQERGDEELRHKGKESTIDADDYDKELEQLNKNRRTIYIDPNEFVLIDTPNGPKIVKKSIGPEILVELDYQRTYRHLSLSESRGNNIMFTLRTTRKYHNQRLTLLYNTWMTQVNSSNIFLVTDGEDKKWLKLASNRGMHYVLTTCGKTYSQYQLCCKAGIELTLMFKKSNEHYDWLCHIDDDMYILLDSLTHILSKFDPKREPIYFGRSGSDWYEPREVKEGAKYGRPGQKYHFAVGGMYCLSRAMLELAKPYLVGGKTFAQSCISSLEPEDVTVGYVVGVVLNKTLSRTEMIYTHGLHLMSTVDPQTLDKQIAFSYGFGATPWGLDDFNCIYVPNGLYTIDEDESQFKSLHCHLHPNVSWCVRRLKELQANNITNPLEFF